MKKKKKKKTMMIMMIMMMKQKRRDDAQEEEEVFNAQPTGTVISKRYTLQSLLIILKNKTRLVHRICF